MSKSKKAQPLSNYVKTIRDGAVAANIFRGNTPDGHTYLYFELSRAWKSLTGHRDGYSRKFYDRNSASLQHVIAEASAWIKAHPEAADGELASSQSDLSAAA